MSAPWFRVPMWCHAMHDEANAARARAWVYLLGAWHAGDDPSTREFRRVTGFGQGRADHLVGEIVAWASENGAAMPARYVASGGPQGVPEQQRSGSGAATERADVAPKPIVEAQRSTNGAAAEQQRSVSRGRVLLSERETEKEQEAAAPAAPPVEPPNEQLDPPGPSAGRGAARPVPADDTLYGVYHGYRPKTQPTPSPDTRKQLKRILTECGSLERAALYLAWTFESRDERALQVRGEAPWPGGKVNAMTSVEELARHIGSRMPMAEVWDEAGRGTVATQGTPKAPDTDALKAWDWICALVRNHTPGQTLPEPKDAAEKRARDALRAVPNGWTRIKTCDDFSRRALRDEFVGRWNEMREAA